MVEMNGSEWFSNVTNHTLPFCSGSSPSKTVKITTYSVLLPLLLVGNSFIVAVFYRNKTLRTSVHYFIVNMAISDLILPVIVLPWLISSACNDYLWLVDGVLGSILCKLVWVAWPVSVTVSIFNMVVIAVDRFHAVLFHMKPPLISQKTCRRIIVVTWVASVALWAYHCYGYRLVCHDTRCYCRFRWGSPSETKKVVQIAWISLMCLSFLSATVLTALYSSIAIFLYRQKSDVLLASEIFQNRAKRNRRINCMLVIVVIFFYAMWFPFIIMVFILVFKPDIILSCFFIWFSDDVLLMLHPILNAVVYYVFNEDYRRGFRGLLCFPWLCGNKCNHFFHSSASPQVENIELQEQ